MEYPFGVDHNVADVELNPDRSIEERRRLRFGHAAQPDAPRRLRNV